MPLLPGQDLQELLESIWREQSDPGRPPQDMHTPAMFPGRAKPADASAQELAERLGERLGWPKWAIAYPKPANAVVAASGLAKAVGKPGGVLWVAPGTGAPLDCAVEGPGVAVLRGDWTPDAQAMRESQEMIRERGLLLVLDETTSGCRLAPGGATEKYGLAPDLALFGPSLAGPGDLAILLGRGEPPKPPQKQPAGPGVDSLAANLTTLLSPETSAELAEMGKLLKKGLAFFRQKAGMGPEMDLVGPDAMPRLTGKRQISFMRLAGEEGLIMASVLMLKPGQDPKAALMRMARAVARLKITPEESLKPEGWTLSGCKRVEEMLTSIETAAGPGGGDA